MGDSTSPGSLIEDLSHGPTIMLAVRGANGYTYVDASRADTDRGAGIEIVRGDGHDVELITAAEADALIEALQVARREVWGATRETVRS